MLISIRCPNTAKQRYCYYFRCLNLMNYLSLSVRFSLDSVFVVQQTSENYRHKGAYKRQVTVSLFHELALFMPST